MSFARKKDCWLDVSEGSVPLVMKPWLWSFCRRDLDVLPQLVFKRLVEQSEIGSNVQLGVCSTIRLDRGPFTLCLDIPRCQPLRERWTLCPELSTKNHSISLRTSLWSLAHHASAALRALTVVCRYFSCFSRAGDLTEPPPTPVLDKPRFISPPLCLAPAT